MTAVADAPEMINSDQWCSPKIEIAEPLAQLFGGPVGIDPCSNARSVILAEVVYEWGGLHLPWKNPLDTGYMNNPYSTNIPWANKAIHEMQVGHLDELVTLMMVATSTAWWSSLCTTKKVRNPRILFTKRLKFIGDKKHGARFDTALKYYGRRHRAFEREFKHITRWSAWGR